MPRWSRATAPPTVAITARYPHQRAAAERIGVTVLGEDEAVAWGKEHRPEVVIESVGGTADTLTDAVRVVGRGGRVVVLGTFSEPRLVDLQRLMMKEASIVGSFCYGSGDREPEFATAARLTGRWRDELAALTTHQLPLDDVADAFAPRRRQDAPVPSRSPSRPRRECRQGSMTSSSDIPSSVMA